MTALKKDWYKSEARSAKDLDKIQGRSRARLEPVPDVVEQVPPFRGISRELLTLTAACDKLDVCMTTLRELIKAKLIFTHPRGRRVYIPIEECENYSERERLRGIQRYA